MDDSLQELMASLPWWGLALAVVVCLAVLGKGADWLVKEAVSLSEKSGIPKVIIGATIVSLGTTVPEAAVSVLAALDGKPELALGNSVGSIICDTGLILGLACLISPLQLPAIVVNRYGWVQIFAGVLLVACAWPWSDPRSAFTIGGVLPQWVGWLFLGLLAVYLWVSVRWSRGTPAIHLEAVEAPAGESLTRSIIKLILSIAVVVVASKFLIPAVTESAMRLDVPPSVIAATLVALGTSLPELVTAVTAARRGHGDLAVGNVVGADILNVLFVAGAAASVTPGGLTAEPHFFQLLFPFMLGILLVFRIRMSFSRKPLKVAFGIVMLACYVVFVVLIVVTQASPLPPHR